MGMKVPPGLHRVVFSLSVIAAGLGSLSVHVVHASSAMAPAVPATRPCSTVRSAVQRGTDRDAHLVNVRSARTTSIARLRSLKAPAKLPQQSRVHPVETTVWSLKAVLLRYRLDSDQSYRLVIEDTHGRTMDAVIPASGCLGARSPFLNDVRGARQVFESRFGPVSKSYRAVHVSVQLTGVGFFDPKHSQSGAAPNGIELNPVLSLGMQSPPAPPPAPSVHPLFITAAVSPSSVRNGARAALTVKAVNGASCRASLVYSPGQPPTSLKPRTQAAPKSGTLRWVWLVKTKQPSGTVTVTCRLHQSTASTMAYFTVRKK